MFKIQIMSNSSSKDPEQLTQLTEPLLASEVDDNEDIDRIYVKISKITFPAVIC